MKARAFLFCMLFLFAIILTACADQTEVETVEEGYPVADTSNTDSDSLYGVAFSYPVEDPDSAEESFFLSEITIPAPEEGQAVVHGILVNIEDDQPYLAPSLYLGSILTTEDESDDAPRLASISVDDDPVARQAVDGTFLFSPVPPGEYGLFFWTPMSIFLIEDAQSGTPIFIEVEPGETLDLGIIYIR